MALQADLDKKINVTRRGNTDIANRLKLKRTSDSLKCQPSRRHIAELGPYFELAIGVVAQQINPDSLMAQDAGIVG